MSTLKFALRAVAAGLMLTSGVAAAAPADFTADVGLALSFVAKSTTETATSTLAYGGTRQVKATVSVPAGVFLAQGITLDFPSIPTDTNYPAGNTPTDPTKPNPNKVVISAVTNCTPTAAAVAAKAKFPCTVVDLKDGETKDVLITLSQTLPAVKPVACNHTATYADPFTVVVTTTATDPDLANNTGSVTPVGVPLVFADLEVVFAGLEVASEGQDVTYSVTVTNHGPCASTDVWAYSDAYGSAPFVSTTAPCLNTGDDFEADGCQLGTIASGATVAYEKVYNIPAMASDAISLYHPNGVSLGGPVSALVTKDYDHFVDDEGAPLYANSSGFNTVVYGEASGCSTAGAGGPTGLLALGAVLALVLRRRRAV